MATVERVIEAPPDAVAAVLADARSYDGFVVGSKRIRWFDARWPEPGTRFHHSVGFAVLHIRDHTTVVQTNCQIVSCWPPAWVQWGRPRSTSH